MIPLEQLAHWKKLCEEATPGPWTVKNGVMKSNDENFGCMKAVEDQCFIAESRTAFPLLLNEVERLNNLIDELKKRSSEAYRIIKFLEEDMKPLTPIDIAQNSESDAGQELLRQSAEAKMNKEVDEKNKEYYKIK